MSGVTNNVIVFLKAENCGHCTTLFKVWQEVCGEMKREEKTLKFVVVPLPGMGASIPKGYPQNLKEFAPWFPFIFMVDGKEWDDAVKKNFAKFERGISFFNAVKEGSGFSHVQKFNRDPKGFASWVREIKNEGGLNSSNVIQNSVIPSDNLPTAIAPKKSAEKVVIRQGGDRRVAPMYASIENCDGTEANVCSLTLRIKPRSHKN